MKIWQFNKFRCVAFITFVFIFNSLYAQNRNVLILGIAQDGGYPHIACKKECCKMARNNPSNSRFIVSMAVVDSVQKKWWLLEATPDFGNQLALFDSITNHYYPYLPEGIFITHAHIGHYTGLQQLGKEALNAKAVNVFVLPRMDSFLRSNGPWSQLVKLQNIQLHQMKPDSSIWLSKFISFSAFTVPHRDEYSETAGFTFKVKNATYLFIPDIDKWSKWQLNISEEIAKVDLAFIDGTFKDSMELPGRKISEIPHPFMTETMEILTTNKLKNKACFIHFNHSNKAMWDVKTQAQLKAAGYLIAQQGKWY